MYIDFHTHGKLAKKLYRYMQMYGRVRKDPVEETDPKEESKTLKSDKKKNLKA